MNAPTGIIAAIALAGVTSVANASLGPVAPVALPRSEVVLAQARDVEIYYDQDGREIIVDAETGHIVAVGRPGGFASPAERRRARERELRGGRREPLGEMLRRERETRLGRDDGEYPRMQRDRYPREGYPSDRFPDAPILTYPDSGRYGEGGLIPDNPSYDGYPGTDGLAGRGPIERRLLDDPQVRATEEAPSTGIGGEDALSAPSADGEIAALPGNAPSVIEQPEPVRQPPQATVPQLGGKGMSEDVAKIQILLDRKGLSPGVIDGRMGDNVNKAISAWHDKTGSALRTYDKSSIDELLASSGGEPFSQYTITAVDAAGPYVASVPEDYGEKARLDHLGYTSVTEALAERFHMDEGYLKVLNPGADFSRPGTVIKVVNIGAPLKAEVTRILADKGRKQVRAYDAAGRLVAVYPATIGSGDTPSPSGTVTVERIAHNPEYTYNPKVNFKQGQNDEVLTIPPGPNGPVGSVWIALSKPTYGIHGTPEPSKIGKTFSHGCVRLTNWDAAELAGLVKPGTVVEFID